MNNIDQLNSLIITDDSDKIKVYKDYYGNIQYDIDDDQNSYLDAQSTYLNSISKKYYVHDKDSNKDNFYDNRYQIYDYYKDKYLDHKPKMEEEDCYNFDSTDKSSTCLSKDEIQNKLEDSIEPVYEYNNKTYNYKNYNEIMSSQLEFKDDQKIKKIDKTPGLFYVEQNKDTKKGLLTGSPLIQSQLNLQKYIQNIHNWDLVDSDSQSMLDFMVGGFIECANDISQSATMLQSAAAGDLTIMENITNDNDELTLTSPFAAYKADPDTITNLINKYQINGEASIILKGINLIKHASLSTKMYMYLYQLKELFRSVDVNPTDYSQLKTIYLKFFKNMDTNNDGWQELVKTFSDVDITDLPDYLINPANLKAICSNLPPEKYADVWRGVRTACKDMKKTHDHFKNQKEWTKIFKNCISKIGKLASKIKPIAKVIESATKVASKVLKYIPFVGMALDILDSINMVKNYTYELVIPDSNNVLTYQYTSFFNNNSFDPETDLDVFAIKTPVDEPTYIDTETDQYYSTYDGAANNIRQEIIDKINAGKYDVDYYASDMLKNYTSPNRQDVIKELQKTVYKHERYLDHFGNGYNDPNDATEGCVKNVGENV